MNKAALIKKITALLITELEGYAKAAQTAHAEATHEQSKAENKYDTRGLEASYLAHGQARLAMEMEAAVEAFEKMGVRSFGAGEPISTGALVVLEHEQERLLYFMAPRAGGLEIVHEKKEVLVITPQSPLGKKMMGCKQGDLLHAALGGASKKCRVMSVT